MKNLKKFSALPGEQKKLLISAAILLPIADLALRLFGYRKTQRGLSRTAVGRKDQFNSDPLAQAQLVANTVRLAARKGPYTDTCLRESLVTCWLLQRRGISTSIKIGIGKEGEFNAHAWVELDDIPVLDGAQPQENFETIYRTGHESSGDRSLQ